MLDTALAHPTIFVRDLDRARAFYENLGLTVRAEVTTGIFMTAGNARSFRSSTEPTPRHPPTPSPHSA